MVYSGLISLLQAITRKGRRGGIRVRLMGEGCGHVGIREGTGYVELGGCAGVGRGYVGWEGTCAGMGRGYVGWEGLCRLELGGWEGVIMWVGRVCLGGKGLWGLGGCAGMGGWEGVLGWEGVMCTW